MFKWKEVNTIDWFIFKAFQIFFYLHLRLWAEPNVVLNAKCTNLRKHFIFNFFLFAEDFQLY